MASVVQSLYWLVLTAVSPFLGIKLITTSSPLTSLCYLRLGPGLLVCNSHKNASHQIESVQGHRGVKSNQISPFCPCPSGHLAARNITLLVINYLGNIPVNPDEYLRKLQCKDCECFQTIFVYIHSFDAELESACVMTWLGPQRWDEDRRERECELKYKARHVITLCLESKLKTNVWWGSKHHNFLKTCSIIKPIMVQLKS